MIKQRLIKYFERNNYFRDSQFKYRSNRLTTGVTSRIVVELIQNEDTTWMSLYVTCLRPLNACLMTVNDKHSTIMALDG